jgi:putative ABC transport system permease protein
MRSPFRGLPIAWLQLKHGRTKLVAAVVGIVFADLLMWMQLGFLAAALASATTIHRQLRGDLVIINPHTHQITSPQPFPRRLLTRAKGHPEVDEVTPLYMGMAKWRDPWTMDKQPLFVYGVVPYSPAIRAPGVMEAAGVLHETDTCLFDAMSRKEFGQVAARVTGGEHVEAEVNGLRRMKVVGTTKIGANFAVDGNMVTSDVNFLRLFPGRPPGSVDLGVVRLHGGARKQQVKSELTKIFGLDLMVLTVDEMVEREQEFLLKSRPINFVFTLGAAVGFLVGFAIVYQVLFTDVNNHLPQYATLKAIGYSDGYLRRVVLHESLILSLLGYFPGALLAALLYAFAVKVTNLPMQMTAQRGALIFILTIVMCGFSSMLAMRKLAQADPAAVF